MWKKLFTKKSMQKSFILMILFSIVVGLLGIINIYLPEAERNRVSSHNKSYVNDIKISEENAMTKMTEEQAESLLNVQSKYLVKERTDKHDFLEDIEIKRDQEDYILNLEKAISINDKTAIQVALDAIAVCPKCLERMISILEDPSYDDKFRHYAAKTLAKSESKEGIIAVVGAIVDAHAQEQHDFKDTLIQELGGMDSIEAADALISIVTGEAYSDLDFSEMPEDLRYAIQKAIRKTTEQEAVGNLLAQKYESEMEPEARNRLADISQPYANIYLAADAYRAGDMETGAKLIGTLDKTGDTHVTEAFLHFAEEKILSVDETAEMMHQWIELDSNSNMQNLEFFNEYLSNFERNPEGRAVAAYAMSFFKDNNEAKYALQKAYDYEENLLLRDYIESALNIMETKSDI